MVSYSGLQRSDRTDLGSAFQRYALCLRVSVVIRSDRRTDFCRGEVAFKLVPAFRRLRRGRSGNLSPPADRERRAPCTPEKASIRWHRFWGESPGRSTLNWGDREASFSARSPQSRAPIYSRAPSIIPFFYKMCPVLDWSCRREWSPGRSRALLSVGSISAKGRGAMRGGECELDQDVRGGGAPAARSVEGNASGAWLASHSKDAAVWSISKFPAQAPEPLACDGIAFPFFVCEERLHDFAHMH